MPGQRRGPGFRARARSGIESRGKSSVHTPAISSGFRARLEPAPGCSADVLREQPFENTTRTSDIVTAWVLAFDEGSELSWSNAPGQVYLSSIHTLTRGTGSERSSYGSIRREMGLPRPYCLRLGAGSDRSVQLREALLPRRTAVVPGRGQGSGTRPSLLPDSPCSLPPGVRQLTALSA